MNFGFGEKQEAFRKQVRDFLKEELPVDWRGLADLEQEAEDYRDLDRQFTRKLGEKHWIGMSWPKEIGGLGATHIDESILLEEMSYHRAPGTTILIVDAGIIGRTILLYGTEEQKKQHLPPILEGRVCWCQGFTEPIGGSDAANFQTRAVEDGDDFVVNGQKTFISFAHCADWCYLIVRTNVDVPKHKGLSYLLVDMKSPGITVRPQINMLGAKGFGEVFFDDVRVPKKNLLGEKDTGWYITAATLDFERYSISAKAGVYSRVLDDLVAYCKETEQNGQALAQDPTIRRKLAERAIDIELLRLLTYRIVWMADCGVISNYEASMAKLYAYELSQRLANTGMDILGLHGQLRQESKWAPLAGTIAVLCLSSPAYTIWGGTSEIQRNIIAMRGLGLPRD